MHRIDAVGQRRRSRRARARGGGAGVITIKSARELDTMARAGRILHATLQRMREIIRPGHVHRGPRRRGRALHPVAPRRDFPRSRGSTASRRRSASRSTRRSSTASPRRGASSRKGRSSRSIAASASRDCTPTRPRPSPSARSRAEAQRLLDVTQAVAGRRHRGGDGRAIRSATSATRCRRWPRRPASAWCANSSVTASARASTRSRRSPTSASRHAALALRAGMTIAIEPMITDGEARHQDAQGQVDRGHGRRHRSPPTSSTRWRFWRVGRGS